MLTISNLPSLSPRPLQKVVLDSIHQDDPTFTGDGYRSLAILYAVFAICNWLAPSALSIIGPRGAMLLGSATYWYGQKNYFIDHLHAHSLPPS